MIFTGDSLLIRLASYHFRIPYIINGEDNIKPESKIYVLSWILEVVEGQIFKTAVQKHSTGQYTLNFLRFLVTILSILVTITKVLKINIKQACIFKA